MKKLKLVLALLMSLAIISSAGCAFLPPIPWPPQITGVTTQIPADLSEAADRILPSTVIVDTRLATGTGWVYDESGIVITNYHVIKDARNVYVTLNDGRRYRATSVVSDAISDLAVLYIDATDMTAAAIGNAATLRIGDQVVAVGNSLGNGISVKTGRITHLSMTVSIADQDFYDLIENTSAIQQGDSGGPLVNKDGEVIGISCAKVGGTREIAYAININTALPILHELIETGTMVWPYLGIIGSDSPTNRGVLINDVAADGPAAGAGLRESDIILAIDGISMRNMTGLRQYILSQQIGQNVTITYQRNEVQTEVMVTLERRPD